MCPLSPPPQLWDLPLSSCSSAPRQTVRAICLAYWPYSFTDHPPSCQSPSFLEYQKPVCR